MARRASDRANRKEVAAQTWAGKVVTVAGEVVTVRKPDGALARFRTHDPAQLADIVTRRGAKVTVNDQYCIMRAGITRAGSTCFSVQADKGEPLEACKVGDLQPDLEGDDLEDDEVES